jgi:uncharacterized protein (DUF433 family)
VILEKVGYTGGMAIRGIERTARICGGEPRLAGTRIPVWLLVQYRKLGATDNDLFQAYPTLGAMDLANAWDYYRFHKDEIDAQITDNEAV